MNEVKFKMKGRDYVRLNHIAYLNGLEVGDVIGGLIKFTQSSQQILDPQFKEQFDNLLRISFFETVKSLWGEEFDNIGD